MLRRMVSISFVGSLGEAILCELGPARTLPRDFGLAFNKLRNCSLGSLWKLIGLARLATKGSSIESKRVCHATVVSSRPTHRSEKLIFGFDFENLFL